MPKQSKKKNRYEEFAGNCRQSLHFTATELLNYKDINERTHGEIIKVLEAPSRRKLICMPRGTLKSSLACVAYPLWLLIKNPNERILIDSELFTNSCTFIREIKAHMQSPLFMTVFGDWRGDTWTQSEVIVRVRSKNYKEPSIMAGGIGTTKVGQHVSVIIADDLNSQNNSNTIENASKVVDHYKHNISILEPQGTYVVIGTRYSSNDVIGHILSNEPNDYQGQESV